MDKLICSECGDTILSDDDCYYCSDCGNLACFSCFGNWVECDYCECFVCSDCDFEFDETLEKYYCSSCEMEMEKERKEVEK